VVLIAQAGVKLILHLRIRDNDARHQMRNSTGRRCSR
jgi:hypothetical protein